MGRLNRRIFHWFNGLSRRTERSIWYKINIIGDLLVVLELVFPLITLRPDIVWAFAWAMLFTSVVVHGLKRGIKARRPPAVLPKGEFILIGPRINLYAYHSGHSATVFSLAGVLVMSIPFSLPRLLLILAALLVACSRMVVGVHWPLDVLSGALIGWAAAWSSVFLAALTPWAFSFLSLPVLGLGLAADLYLLLYYDVRYRRAVGTQRFVVVACLTLGLGELLKLLFNLKSHSVPSPPPPPPPPPLVTPPRSVL